MTQTSTTKQDDATAMNNIPSSSEEQPKRNPWSNKIQQLFLEAYKDVQNRHLFSPYDSGRVLDYFDGVISLVSVFLYEN